MWLSCCETNLTSPANLLTSGGGDLCCSLLGVEICAVLVTNWEHRIRGILLQSVAAGDSARYSQELGCCRGSGWHQECGLTSLDCQHTYQAIHIVQRAREETPGIRSLLRRKLTALCHY